MNGLVPGGVPAGRSVSGPTAVDASTLGRDTRQRSITVEQLLKLLDGAQMNGPTAKAWLGRSSSPNAPIAPPTAAQQRFLEDVAQFDRRVIIQAHPEDQAQRPMDRKNAPKELTPAAMMWLQRLPVEADRIVFDDAVRLAALHDSVDPRKDPDGAQLLASIWQPVKDRFDELVARSRIKVLERTVVIPGSTVAAVRDALKVEFPEAGTPTLEQKARDVVEKFRTDLQSRRERELTRARSTLSEVLDRRKQRDAMTRESETTSWA